MAYLITSESVSEGHPDKISDQVSDAILDAMIAQDPNSRVAMETLVTTGLVMLAGEITTKATVDVQKIARETIEKIGYTSDEYQFDAKSCSVLNAVHEQSPDISQGVTEGEGADKEQGAGDQGMMFGYACNETDNYMPLSLELSHSLVQELAKIRKEGKKMKYLRPDSKSQVTIDYDKNMKPQKIDTIVVSTQHDPFVKPKDDSEKAQAEADEQMRQKIEDDIHRYLIPAVKKNLPQRIKKLFKDEEVKYYINPTGKFIIGGPHGDTGLTGRKIIVDTYGGRGAHGGGAFSGKDPSKVDRSAAYASRHIAKNLVAAGVCQQALVQVSYAIGVSEPVSVNVFTYKTGKVKMTDLEITEKVEKMFKERLKPKNIVDRFNLKYPIYAETAAYGHMGRVPFEREVELNYVDVNESASEKTTKHKKSNKTVEFFPWEKLDLVDEIKKAFNIQK